MVEPPGGRDFPPSFLPQGRRLSYALHLWLFGATFAAVLGGFRRRGHRPDASSRAALNLCYPCFSSTTPSSSTSPPNLPLHPNDGGLLSSSPKVRRGRGRRPLGNLVVERFRTGLDPAILKASPKCGALAISWCVRRIWALNSSPQPVRTLLSAHEKRRGLAS